MWRTALRPLYLSRGPLAQRQLLLSTIRHAREQTGGSGKFFAVVRWDNNVVTIPFVGREEEASALASRMTAEQHKHHVFIRQVTRPRVPAGPYRTLEEVPYLMPSGSKV